jgi:spectinomycin phosphotransferase
VAPRPARSGALWTRFAGLPCVLYDVVPGRRAGNPGRWADATLAAVAEALGRLHRDTAALAAAVPAARRHAEAFDLGFEDTLWTLLDALEAGRVPEGPAPGAAAELRGAWAEARETIPPLRGAIRSRMTRLRALRDRARAAHPDGARMVLCHTDVNGDNVLVDDAGAVALLDWEGAKLAPRELDVRYVLDPGRLDLALGAYERGAGPVRLDVDVLAFDLYRRPLFELRWYLGRALAPAAAPAQRVADLREAAAHARGWWHRGWWGEEDAGIEMVAARLGTSPSAVRGRRSE